ncbi:MAG: hypothetical protein WCG78_02125 [Candidatus Omnitrophota bacterium]
MKPALTGFIKVLVLFFVIFSACHARAEKGGSFRLSAPDTKEPPRAVWVWDVKIAGSKEASARLIDFCRSRNIGRIYLTAYAVNDLTSQGFRAFNQSAHAADILVHALAGDPRWGVEKYHQQPLRWIGDIIAYNRRVRPEERFDGIENDTEIYLLGRYWDDNKESILKEYLDLNRKIMDLKEIEESKITYACDIPFWYDDDESMVVTWNGRTKPPSFHLLDTVDMVTVMDYRNFTDGPNGSIELVRKELEYARLAGKKVYVGQETQENLYPEYVTFAKMGEVDMEARIGQIVAAYRDNPAFAGIAMHHYISYRKLVEKK